MYHFCLRCVIDNYSIFSCRLCVVIDRKFQLRILTVFNTFRFVSSRHIPPKPYVSELNSSTTYGQIPYGTRYFREEFPDVWLTKVI